MKDVENLFKRLGTSSEYKDFGSKVLDDVRQKWPLLQNVSEAEKSRIPTHAKSDAETVPQSPKAEIAKAVDSLVRSTLIETEGKLPVRSFLSKKRPSQESAREIFKSIGKSPRLAPSNDEFSSRAKGLFDGSKLKGAKKI